MQCPRCQQENDADVRFCESCGAQLARLCARCGQLLKPHAKFCGKCGASRVDSQQSLDTRPEKMGATRDDRFGSTSDLHEHESQARVTTEGERRQLTVLFSDLVGSTALSTQLDPEDYRDLTAAYHGAAAAAVERFGGHVAKYLGDGLLAYFGYPLAHEDDAERAVRAGLAMVEAVRSLDTRPEKTGAARDDRIGPEPFTPSSGPAFGPPFDRAQDRRIEGLHVRVGLHTGASMRRRGTRRPRHRRGRYRQVAPGADAQGACFHGGAHVARVQRFALSSEHAVLCGDGDAPAGARLARR